MPSVEVIVYREGETAQMVLDAIAAGKDVYCEKPVSYDVREGRAMADVKLLVDLLA